MAEFSVRIDFYRSPDKPPQDAGYVGSALRDGFHAVVLPRVASTCTTSALAPGDPAPTATPTAWSRPSSTTPPRHGRWARPDPRRSAGPASPWWSALFGPEMAR